jgi:hypothetical protein
MVKNMEQSTNPTSYSVSDIRRLLSKDEHQKAKDKINKAEQTLEDVKILLSSALFLQNGKLSSGTIEYTAFRIETLSLFFEVAMRNYRISSQSGDKAYQDFLEDLGDEVGFTFARDLINRLTKKDFFLHIQDMRKLINLWASFENDTGAGITKLKKYSNEKIIIELKNNPLRRRESFAHAHCGFYKSYLKALINEMFTARSRILEAKIDTIRAKAYKVINIEEQPDGEDNCIFILKCSPEVLIQPFDYLKEAYDQFYQNVATGNFVGSMTQARAAIKEGQLAILRWNEETKRPPPRSIYKVFKGLLSNKDFKRMDDSYQRVSAPLHPELKQKSNMDKDKVWANLRDVRRTIYSLESLNLTNEKRRELVHNAIKTEQLDIINKYVRETENLEKHEKQQINKLLADVKKGELKDEERQTQLITLLKKIGGKAFEIAIPILKDILTATVKKTLGI